MPSLSLETCREEECTEVNTNRGEHASHRPLQALLPKIVCQACTSHQSEGFNTCSNGQSKSWGCISRPSWPGSRVSKQCSATVGDARWPEISTPHLGKEPVARLELKVALVRHFRAARSPQPEGGRRRLHTALAEESREPLKPCLARNWGTVPRGCFDTIWNDVGRGSVARRNLQHEKRHKGAQEDGGIALPPLHPRSIPWPAGLLWISRRTKPATAYAVLQPAESWRSGSRLQLR